MSDQKSLPGPSDNPDPDSLGDSSQNVELSDLDRARAKRGLILLGIVLAGAFAIWSSYKSTVNDTALRPGVYLGAVQAGTLANFEFFAEKNPNLETVKVVPFSSDWPAQEVHSDGLKEVPISLSSPSGRIELVIENASEHKFSGPVFLSGTREQLGTWFAQSIETFKFSRQSELEAAAIKRTIGLFSEEAAFLSEIRKYQDQISALRAKFKVGETGPTPEQQAELAALTAEAVALEKTIATLTESLTQANNKLNVELKVSKSGKLAQLAREAEAREERWRLALYRTDPESMEPELFSKLSEAERISQIKNQIAAEQIRVFGGSRIAE